MHSDSTQSKKTTESVPKELVFTGGPNPHLYPRAPTPIVYNVHNHYHLHGKNAHPLSNMLGATNPNYGIASPGYYQQAPMAPYAAQLTYPGYGMPQYYGMQSPAPHAHQLALPAPPTNPSGPLPDGTMHAPKGTPGRPRKNRDKKSSKKKSNRE